MLALNLIPGNPGTTSRLLGFPTLKVSGNPGTVRTSEEPAGGENSDKNIISDTFSLYKPTPNFFFFSGRLPAPRMFKSPGFPVPTLSSQDFGIWCAKFPGFKMTSPPPGSQSWT